MKISKLTSALIALGLVSVASVAMADSTVSIGGQTYTEVFITGSTAARGNIFNAVNTAHSGAAQPNGSGGLFDAVPTYVTHPTGGTVNGSTGNYTAYGTINGQRYCLCFSWTGSEAGLWALQHNVNGIPNPVAANTLGGNPAYANAAIPGTPAPTSFVDPNTGNFFSAPADLSMADTSQAVSLSASPALNDFGIVGAVTFEWVKGKDSSPDSAYNNLLNVTDPQMNILLGGFQTANFLTGVAADSSDYVFAVGRNKASGTHQNTMIDTQHGTTTAVDQWVANNATYNSSGQLTVGAVASLSSVGGITEVFNDGYDSGGGVAATLACDAAGSQKLNSQGSVLATVPVILVGYLGIGDAAGAIAAGAKALTLNGVAENDASVINGTYSFWGHEHLYSTPSPDAAITTVGQALAGSHKITSFSDAKANLGSLNGALRSAGGLGGGEANPASTQSTIIAPEFMGADKPQGSDSGYPSTI